MFWVYFFFLLDDVKLFLALVDMNYLIVISVNNTMEANYFVVFIFSSNRKKKQLVLRKQLYPQGFLYERKGVQIFFLFSQRKTPGDKV